MPCADAVRAQLTRILANGRFAKSPCLSRFLRFTVEQTLAGNADALKEYAIGVEVFRRKPSFDPRTDGIVRVQAVNLRSRLASYYEKEGANDPILIEYVKGHYAPALRERGSGSTASGDNNAAADSIAVLPFVNMSSDPENEYFSDGLTEELIGVLSNVHGLRVVARTSVFRYKGKGADVRQIGAELSARMILEGSVRKAGKRLCITSQLVDAQTGYHKWARTYRVEMKDLFAVQQEIATAIAASLREHGSTHLMRQTGNLDAYHLYLKGRFYLNKWTEDAFRKSIGFFQAAVDADPGFAAAYAGLADAQFVLACYGNVDPREVMPKARAAAEKALDLGDRLAEPHVSLAAVRAVYEWDWSGAEADFLLAMNLDPSNAVAHQWYGVLCLIPQGRFAEAETAIREARDLDPLSPPINTSLGLVYFVQNRYDEAVSCFERAIEIEPNFDLAHWWLAAIYFNRAMLPEAFRSLRKTGVLSQSRFHDAAKFISGSRTGVNPHRARGLLRDLTAPSGERYVSPLLVAALHVTLGAHDIALDWLHRAVKEHDPWVAWIGVDRRFDPIRTDPRFTALLRETGLVGGPIAETAMGRGTARPIRSAASNLAG